METEQQLDAVEFYRAVLEIPAPKDRQHELATLEKLIGPLPEPEPLFREYFVSSDALATCTKHEFLRHLVLIGVNANLGYWGDGRWFQFIKLARASEAKDVLRIAKWTFRGTRVSIVVARKKSVTV